MEILESHPFNPVHVYIQNQVTWLFLQNGDFRYLLLLSLKAKSTFPFDES